MEVDYDIVKTVRELEKKGHDEGTISKKLGEMGYTPGQIAEIMSLSRGVDGAEREERTKKVLIALVVGFLALVFAMAFFAIFIA